MKLNKTFGRIATTLVATAMLASVAAVPAFAVENGGVITGTDGAAIQAITFNKTLRLPIDVDIPTVTFTFSLDAPTGPVDENATDASSSQTIPVEAGTGSWDKTVSFSSGDEDLAVDGTTTKTVTKEVSFGVPTFSAAGVYKYLLTEDILTDDDTSATLSDFTQSDETRAVYFFVKNVEIDGQSKPVVTGAIISDSDSFTTVAADKTDTIVNYYMLEGDPDDDKPDEEPDVKANDLTITKKVDGDMGNRTEEFEFSIIVGTSGSGKTYNYFINGKEAETPIAAGAEIPNIKLSHDDTIRITGLSADETVQITEDAAMVNGTMNSDGYTTTYQVTNGDLTPGNTVTTGLATDSDGKVISTTVTFTNTRAAVSPTGLIMDIAPYALLVVVAAAGCFVFLRKRRED